MMLQLLSYQIEIYKKTKSPVVVIVLYASKSKREIKTLEFQDHLDFGGKLKSYFAQNVFNFRIRLLDLRKMEKEYMGRKGLTTKSILYIMNNIWSLDKKKLVQFFKLTEGLSQQDRQLLTEIGVGYIRKMKGVRWNELREAEKKALKKGEQTMPLVLSSREELKQKALLLGERNGLQKGRTDIALNLLKYSFNISTISKVTGLSAQQIKKIKQNTKSKK